MGKFALFQGLPILHGFQWENIENLSLGHEPEMPANNRNLDKLEEVMERLRKRTGKVLQPTVGGPYYLDVRSFVAHQFMAAGVLPEHIEMYLTGTYTSSGHDRDISYRRA